MATRVNSSEHLSVVPQLHMEVVNRLATIFNKSVQKNEAAHQEAFEWVVSACREGQWDVLEQGKELIKKLAPYWGISLLSHAIVQGETVWTEALIRRQIDVHSEDAEGNTSLHSAAKMGACDLIEKLHVINIDTLNRKQQTPLHVAIQWGQHQFVAALIQKGANVNHPIPVGEGNFIILDGLGFAVMRGEMQCIDELIKSEQCRLTFPYKGIGSVLHVAIQFHQLGSLRHLLSKYKPQLAIELCNHDDLTPVSFAAALGEHEAVEVLHSYKASIDAADRYGRQPMHHAAMGCHQETIKLLASIGAEINPTDQDGNTPLNLLNKSQDEDSIKSCRGLLINLIKSRAVHEMHPKRHLLPPANLVFRGGGPKGLAFVGALAVLHQKGLLKGVERVAGTSAGAITAALVAINYPIDKLQTLMQKTDLTSFLDHPALAAGLDDANISSLRKLWQTCVKSVRSFQALYRHAGVCEGESFREWFEQLVYNETKTKYLTFGELAKLISNGKPYKHLHVYATKAGNVQEIVHMNSGDPCWENVIISDAVRASMSIPGVFKPHVLHFKQQGARIPAPQLGYLLDGGMLYNFPVETFDQKQFLTRENLGDEGKYPKYNQHTIGFSLYSSLDKKVIDLGEIKTGKELLQAIFGVYINAENAIRQLNPYNASRVIEIDVGDVGTLSFSLTEDQKKRLIESGQAATKTFLEQRGGTTLVNTTDPTLSTAPEPSSPLEWLTNNANDLLTQRGTDRWFPLHKAAQRGHIEAIKQLLAMDPTLMVKRMPDGLTPLHYAVKGGSMEAVDLILQKDPQQIFQFNVDNWTPLHVAALNGHVEIGKKLLQKNSSLLNHTDIASKTPLMIAEKEGHTAFVEWIKSEGGTKGSSCQMM